MKDKEYEYCLVCGKRLKKTEYRLIGVGPECQRKLINKRNNTKLFKLKKEYKYV